MSIHNQASIGGGSESFYVDKSVAGDLLKACDDLVAEFKALDAEARILSRMSGFGTLASGLALQKKFQDKAFGGSDSLVNALESHITVVDNMRAYFQKCIDNAVTQERTNVDQLRNVEIPN
ncbi:hypothetical protein [Rhodococcus sp. ARC_M6]|uniref:hypothetical protein n=1 Tax=Rhodococcus sp. ARC_M6 TaxID=2928852 RepID=UPI001FB290BB|nr:hypothetical protein [Rhodococcus sp. ARC_M6]MCJ0906524.1 hypothetical protein [Rhodococcus sp. ARC_M6]